MATLRYDGRDAYRDGAVAEPTTYGRRTSGGQMFIWAAWAVAAVFWAFTLTTAVGILTSPGAAPEAGGVAWLIVGVVVLGLALAYGAYRYANRDRRRDPLTEASTAALYDEVERQGGDDVVDTSPEVEKGRRERP